MAYNNYGQFEKDFNRLQSNLKKITRALNDSSVTNRLARKVKEIVYRRVKSGYGVDDDTTKADDTERLKLKALSKSYVDWRKGLVVFYTKNGKVLKFGKSKASYHTNYDTGRRTRIKKASGKSITAPRLGEFGRPEKSNLTLSGQMLNAMKTSYGPDGFQIYIADTPRKRVHPKRKPDGLTNKEVAEYVSDNGRPFMALTAGEVRILKAECEKIIREKIAKLIR